MYNAHFNGVSFISASRLPVHQSMLASATHNLLSKPLAVFPHSLAIFEIMHKDRKLYSKRNEIIEPSLHSVDAMQGGTERDRERERERERETERERERERERGWGRGNRRFLMCLRDF